MSDQLIDPEQEINIEEKEILSKVFHTFNTTIEKLRSFQANLEERVRYLTNELNIKNREMHNILESLPNGLIVTDLEGNVRNFNRAAELITSKKKREVLETNVSELFEEAILPSLGDPRRLKEIEIDYLQTHNSVDHEGKKKIIESHTTLMTSESSHQPLGIIINLHDVTILKRLEEEAERINRLTAMGEIAANVAHEIRNPLGSIELFISTLKLDFKNDEEKMEIFNHIMTGIRSMNHIISNLLGYAKPRPIAPSKIDINGLAQEFIGFSGHLATLQGINLITKFESEEIHIKGDKEMMRQILHNLFTNAVQSMTEGGQLTLAVKKGIETSSSRVKMYNLSSSQLPEKLPVCSIIISDEGKGMTPEIKRRVFDPFFTTKEKGTGLGMSIIRNIINSHNGVIDIDSEEDKGTTVTVNFAILGDSNYGK